MSRPFEVSLSAVVAFAIACLLAVVFAGCTPSWQVCEVDLNDHPSKPRPAAQATVRCSRTVLCDVADGATCDGKPLAEVAR